MCGVVRGFGIQGGLTGVGIAGVGIDGSGGASCRLWRLVRSVVWIGVVGSWYRSMTKQYLNKYHDHYTYPSHYAISNNYDY